VKVRIRRKDGFIQRYNLKPNTLKLFRFASKSRYYYRVRKAVKPKILKVKAARKPRRQKQEFWAAGQYSRKDNRTVAVKFKAYSVSEAQTIMAALGEKEGPTVGLELHSRKPKADDYYTVSRNKLVRLK